MERESGETMVVETMDTDEINLYEYVQIFLTFVFNLLL